MKFNHHYSRLLKCGKLEKRKEYSFEGIQPLPFMIGILLMIFGLCCIFYGIVQGAEEPIYLKASWYSMDSLKKEGTFKTSKGVMANGKVFDENSLTCATRLFALGSKVRITNLTNSRSIVVLVTDRIGKRFATTRIDLSKRAFAQIADCKQGIVKVKVEVIR